MTTSNAKIIEAAVLKSELEKIDSKGEELERADRRWKAAISQLDRADIAQVVMVSKLLDGKSYSVTSDNPEHIRRATELAQAIGASWTENVAVVDSVQAIIQRALGTQGDAGNTMIFFPPSHPVQ